MADIPLSAQMEDEYKVSKWNRNTVADGTWLQKYTIEKLNDRDIFLANAIDTNSDDIREALNQEIETRINDDAAISAALTGVSGDFYTFSANVENSASTIVNTIETFSSYVENSAAELNKKINNESHRAQDREDELANKIDTLEAATDVIMVYGTYPDFVNTSAELWNVSAGYLTENDVVKILIDDSQGNSANQTYYQAKNVDYDTSSCTWSKIGELDPYYNTAQIDEYFNILSGTIADNYLSANGTDISAGKNLDVVIQSNNPRVSFKTKDDVSFNNLTSTNINATTTKSTYFSGNTIYGDTLYSTIDKLIGSAQSGANASAWLAANTEGTSAKYAKSAGSATIAYQAQNLGNVGSADVIGSAQSGKFAWDIFSGTKITGYNGTTPNTAYLSAGFAIKAGDNLTLTYADKTFTLNAGDTGITAISAGNTKYTGPVFSASAGTGINFVNDSNNVLGIKASNSLINSATGGSAAYNWITGQSATLSAGPGIIFNSAAPNTLGISVDNSLLGDYVPTSAVECLIGSGNHKTSTSTGIYLAQGSANGVDGWNSYAFGLQNSAGANSFTLGRGNSAFGESMAQGLNNSAYSNSIAQGKYCSATSNGQAFGSYLSINGGMAIGNYNKTSSNVAFVIGNGVYEPTVKTQSDLFLISSNGLISGDSIKLGDETNSTTSQFYANEDSYGFVHSGYDVYQDFAIDQKSAVEKKIFAFMRLIY